MCVHVICEYESGMLVTCCMQCGMSLSVGEKYVFATVIRVYFSYVYPNQLKLCVLIVLDMFMFVNGMSLLMSVPCLRLVM